MNMNSVNCCGLPILGILVEQWFGSDIHYSHVLFRCVKGHMDITKSLKFQSQKLYIHLSEASFYSNFFAHSSTAYGHHYTKF